MAVILSSCLGDVFLIAAVTLGIVYLCVARKLNHWEEQGVACVKPLPLLGSMPGVFLQRESLGACLKRLYQHMPAAQFFGVYALGEPKLVVRDLELVRRVLVKDSQAFLDRTFAADRAVEPLLSRSLLGLKGGEWRHLRVKLTPTFTSGKMRRMFYLVEECGEHLVACIDREVSPGEPVIIKEIMARYSTDVIASCAFGVNANALEDRECEFRSVMRKAFEHKGLRTLNSVLLILLPSLVNLLKLRITDESVYDYVRQTFWKVVDHRKKSGIVRKDFVDLLMQIMDEGEVRSDDTKDLEDIDDDSAHLDRDHSNNEKSKIKLEADDIVAQAFIFLTAGFETSSSVITFTLYELALNQHIQQRLRQEISTVLNKHKGQLTYDALAEMVYLDMVVSEAQRKFPTLPYLDRKCVSDYKIPGTDVVVRKGVSIMVPVLGIHYDPDIYPQPDTFDPERFSVENKSRRHHFAHLPFGEGPRMCIGMRFGLMQVKTAVVHVVTSYHVKPCELTPVQPLEMKPSRSIMDPKKPIVLVLAKINNSRADK